MAEPAGFHAAFAAALRGTSRNAGHHPRLSVYRNTVLAGSVDALASLFPTVEKMVGPAWMRAAAAAFAIDNPPASPSLLAYGDTFPKWLSHFPPAEDTPYLSAIADIDRLRWTAYFADDAQAMAPAALATLEAQDISTIGIALHPSARIARFEGNIVSLWHAHQDKRLPDAFMISNEREDALIVRPEREVNVVLIDASTLAFLDACQRGESLLQAASCAAEAGGDASVAKVLHACLSAGAFSTFLPITS